LQILYKSVLFLFAFLAINAQAQTVLNCSGNTIRDNNYIFEYSIGEIVVSTVNSTGNNVTQGLLQPSQKVVDPDCEIINDPLSYFESPTRDKIRIVGRYDWIKAYQIFASDGKLIAYKNFYNNYIDITGLPAAGIYFIRLMPGCNGKFKVIKFMKR
jgi:hypothetical protein